MEKIEERNRQVGMRGIDNILYMKYIRVAEKNGYKHLGHSANIMSLNIKIFEKGIKEYIKENEK